MFFLYFILFQIIVISFLVFIFSIFYFIYSFGNKNVKHNFTIIPFCPFDHRHILDKPSVPPGSSGGGHQREDLHGGGGINAEGQKKRALLRFHPTQHWVRHL